MVSLFVSLLQSSGFARREFWCGRVVEVRAPQHENQRGGAERRAKEQQRARDRTSSPRLYATQARAAAATATVAPSSLDHDARRNVEGRRDLQSMDGLKPRHALARLSLSLSFCLSSFK